MTAKDLKALQNRIKFDGRAMMESLGIDYEQYRRFVSGHAAIPPAVERAALELEAIQILHYEERYGKGGVLDQIMADVPYFMGEETSV